MSWIVGTATDYNDLSDELVAAATGTSLETVDSVAAGGSSYVVGDILTLSGGTFTIAAQVEVTAESSGAVTGTRRYNDGVYTVAPGDPVSTTGGTGTGCTLNCTFATNGWTAHINQVYSSPNKEVWLEGSGGGSDEIFGGWRTFHNTPSGYYNFEFHGGTGYASGNNWEDQPGISPGFFDAGLTANRSGSYLLCTSSSLAYWLSVTSYRMILVTKVGTAYFNAYLGWGNRFATASENPYPFVVAGHTSAYNDLYTQTKQSSGLVDPWRSVSGEGSTRGSMSIWMPDGTWYDIANSSISASARNALTVRVVLPCAIPGGATSAAAEDRFMGSGNAWSTIIPTSGLNPTPIANLHHTPGLTQDFHILLPTVVVFYSPSAQVVLEIDDVHWTSAFDGVASEDRIIDDNSEVHRVFQNCNRTNVFAYLAIKEG